MHKAPIEANFKTLKYGALEGQYNQTPTNYIRKYSKLYISRINLLTHVKETKVRSQNNPRAKKHTENRQRKRTWEQASSNTNEDMDPSDYWNKR